MGDSSGMPSITPCVVQTNFDDLTPGTKPSMLTFLPSTTTATIRGFMPGGVWPEHCVSDRPWSEAQCARRPIWGERSPSVPADFSAVGALPPVLGLKGSHLSHLGSH